MHVRAVYAGGVPCQQKLEYESAQQSLVVLHGSEKLENFSGRLEQRLCKNKHDVLHGFARSRIRHIRSILLLAVTQNSKMSPGWFARLFVAAGVLALYRAPCP